LHGLVEGGPTENGLNEVLNFTVEVVQGGVEGSSGGVDPTKDAVVDGVLDSIHLGVDLVNVEGGLVQHVIVQGGGDSVREIRGGRECFVPIRVGDGTKCKQLDLNGKETDEADKEARESGRVENVTEEPSDVDVLRVRKVKERGELISDPHEKRVSGDSVEGEKIVVRELDGGR
jgi:hypothetical protein